MKKNLFSAVRGYLLAGTVISGALSAGMVCNPAPPVGYGAYLWDCECACGDISQGNFGTVCGDNIQAAQGNCSSLCGGRGCIYGAIAGPYNDPACGSGAEGPGLWSGPGPQSSEAKLDAEESVAAMTLWGDTTSARIGGDVSFTGGCETGRCAITFEHMFFAPGDFAFRGPEGEEIRISHATLVNSGAIEGIQSEGVFTIASEQVAFLVNGDVNGANKSYLVNLERDQDFSGYYVPSSGKFGITARFAKEGGSLELALDVRGTATARPPVADAGRAQEVVADRGSGRARVTLDGSGTVDYDEDLVEIDWYEGEHYLGTGTLLDTDFGVGRHTVTATAIDGTRKEDSAETTVTVVE